MTLQQLRVGLSGAGLALAVAAIALDVSWLVWAAIGVLAVSLGVRVLQRRSQREKPPSPRA